MKRIIPFSRYFIPAAILSGALIVLGIVGLAAVRRIKAALQDAKTNFSVDLPKRED